MSTQSAYTPINPEIYVPPIETAPSLPQVDPYSIPFRNEVSITVARARKGKNTLIDGLDRQEVADFVQGLGWIASRYSHIEPITVNPLSGIHSQEKIKERDIDPVNSHIGNAHMGGDHIPLIIIKNLEYLIGTGGTELSKSEAYAAGKITGWLKAGRIAVAALTGSKPDRFTHTDRMAVIEAFSY